LCCRADEPANCFHSPHRGRRRSGSLASAASLPAALDFERAAAPQPEQPPPKRQRAKASADVVPARPAAKATGLEAAAEVVPAPLQPRERRKRQVENPTAGSPATGAAANPGEQTRHSSAGKRGVPAATAAPSAATPASAAHAARATAEEDAAAHAAGAAANSTPIAAAAPTASSSQSSDTAEWRLASAAPPDEHASPPPAKRRRRVCFAQDQAVPAAVMRPDGLTGRPVPSDTNGGAVITSSPPLRRLQAEAAPGAAAVAAAAAAGVPEAAAQPQQAAAAPAKAAAAAPTGIPEVAAPPQQLAAIVAPDCAAVGPPTPSPVGQAEEPQERPSFIVHGQAAGRPENVTAARAALAACPEAALRHSAAWWLARQDAEVNEANISLTRLMPRWRSLCWSNCCPLL